MSRPDRPPYSPSDTVAGKYLLRRILGEGGMAVVYSAVDTTCDRQVAIKILRPGVVARRPLSAAAIQREAATVVKLHDRTPHVVEVLTAGITDDSHRLPYYVMERLHGASLRAGIEEKRARQTPFELPEITSTATEIAVALGHAHEMGIVHRDVKPENVYLAEQRDRAYIVKLLDFGISALMADEPGARSRTFSGSRPYASPEQLDGRPTTPASDIYSLGLILYEMFTLTLPHDRHNPALSVAQTALNVLQMPYVEPHTLRADIPERVEMLIFHCLAYRPDMRPTAAQVATKLRIASEMFAREVLGDDANSTDVSGPPAAVLMRRLDDTSGFAEPHGPQRFGAPRAVDLHAATQAPATPRMPVDHEVFFDNPVHGAPERDRTDPMPEVFAGLGPAATVPLPAPPLVAPTSPEATARLPALQAATPAPPPPQVVIPPWTPVIATNHTVEGFASRTEPGPAAAPRRGVRPAAIWMLLAACMVAMVVIAMVPGALARRAAARAAASASTAPVAMPLLPPVAVAPAVPQVVASASPVAAPSSSAPTPPATSTGAVRRAVPSATTDPEFKTQLR
jgi:serine/threonine-protein kinase